MTNILNKSKKTYNNPLKKRELSLMVKHVPFKHYYTGSNPVVLKSYFIKCCYIKTCIFISH
jgi:hypothetical protein